jgi:hypothetical protein
LRLDMVSELRSYHRSPRLEWIFQTAVHKIVAVHAWYF